MEGGGLNQEGNEEEIVFKENIYPCGKMNYLKIYTPVEK